MIRQYAQQKAAAGFLLILMLGTAVMFLVTPASPPSSTLKFATAAAARSFSLPSSPHEFRRSSPLFQHTTAVLSQKFRNAPRHLTVSQASMIQQDAGRLGAFFDEKNGGAPFNANGGCNRRSRTDILKVRTSPDSSSSPENPLAGGTLLDVFDFQRGDEGILWVPESAKSAGESDMLSQPSTVKEIVRMPLFPLSVVYLPGSKEVLNIFEQRYRKMYNDILHNGSKRFAVALTNNGRITEYGVCLHIDDIQDVSEQTNDQIKYRVTHTVNERIRVLRILNPEALKDNTKYLQAEVEVLLDNDDREDLSPLHDEAQLTRKMFEKFVELQTRYNETVRFNQDVVKELSMDRDGLWRAIGLWKTYMTQMAIQKEKILQEQITEVVKNYFIKNGKAVTNEPIRVNFDELPKPVQDELNILTQRFQADTDTMGGGPYPFQRLLQLKGHETRLDFFKKLVKIQQHRLMAQEMLRNFEREKNKRRGERKRRKRDKRGGGGGEDGGGGDEGSSQ
mmetsp:Transcript_39297/g.62937  ORF Transcript_39297/g.62937 Transcript_39297/m.62937 type:complete len:506 (+) Transcript_39297:38-1555(+)